MQQHSTVRAALRRARASAIVVLALGAGLVAPAPASAHAELDTISPADGSSVEILPTAVQLRFTEDVATPAAVSVTGPSGAQLVDGEPAVLGDRLVQKLDDRSDGPGAYTVAWQATSQDGHLVYGVSTFTVAGSGVAANGSVTGSGTTGHKALVLGLGVGLLLAMCLALAGIGRVSREVASA